MRETVSDKIIGLASNFDNNMALISKCYPRNIERKNDLLIKLFNELIDFDLNLKQYIPTLTEQIVTDAIKSTGMRVQSKKITEFIMNGYNLINK